jgi:hypothetical protein
MALHLLSLHLLYLLMQQVKLIQLQLLMQMESLMQTLSQLAYLLKMCCLTAVMPRCRRGLQLQAILQRERSLMNLGVVLQMALQELLLLALQERQVLLKH